MNPGVLSAETLDTPPGQSGRPRWVGTVSLLLMLGVVALCPVDAGYSAFTRQTPVWLQWALVGLICATSLWALAWMLIGGGAEWRRLHPVGRWLDLLGVILVPCCLLWFMLRTSLPFHERMGDGLMIGAAPFLISKALVSGPTARWFGNGGH